MDPILLLIKAILRTLPGLRLGSRLVLGKAKAFERRMQSPDPREAQRAKRDYAVFMGSLTAFLIVALLAIFLAAGWPVLVVVVGIWALIKVLGLLFFV